MKNEFGSQVIMHAGLIPEVLEDFSENFFAVSISYDLIENFPQHFGLNFLYEVDRVRAFSSVLHTPNGLGGRKTIGVKGRKTLGTPWTLEKYV